LKAGAHLTMAATTTKPAYTVRWTEEENERNLRKLFFAAAVDIPDPMLSNLAQQKLTAPSGVPWRAAKQSGARQHAHPARSHPGGSAACAACPRASGRSPVKLGQRCAQSCKLPWRPRDFTRPAFGPRRVRCGGCARALDRTKCQAGGRLSLGWGKCGRLRALTPRVCACVLVACEFAAGGGGSRRRV
jgi:hypothetical protein